MNKLLGLTLTNPLASPRAALTTGKPFNTAFSKALSCYADMLKQGAEPSLTKPASG
jgi:hypothetical protein